jgi:hypothetical protein
MILKIIAVCVWWVIIIGVIVVFRICENAIDRSERQTKVLERIADALEGGKKE